VCPDMPTSQSEWKESSFWAVLIDGKDAQKGPNVYDWDHDFFAKVSTELSAIYKKEGTREGKQKLSQKIVEDFHENVFGKTKDKLGNVVQYGTNRGGDGIIGPCTDKLKCDDLKSLLRHVPKEIFTAKTPEGKQKLNAHSCPKGLQKAHLTGARKEVMLGEMIHNYTHGVKAAKGNKKKMLTEVVKFSRVFAMMHPFQNGNGRVKNLILQRELRRLGIACGTMMYNYNKDVLVDGFPRHVRKVEEGIRVFDETVAAKSTENPWLDEKTVDRHKTDFAAIHGLDKCFAKKKFGSGGSIAFKVSATPQDEASVTAEDVA